MANVSRTTRGTTVVLFHKSNPGGEVVAHPAAESRKALAVDLSAMQGTNRMAVAAQAIPAGRYRVTWLARLHQPAADDDLARLSLEIAMNGGAKGPSVRRPLVWTQFNSATNRFTPIEMEFTATAPFTPTFDLAWQQLAVSTKVRAKPIRQIKIPTTPDGAGGGVKKKPSADDELIADLATDSRVVPLAAIDYPALIVERATIEPVSRTQWIEEVHPRFVHIYPVQENPIAVSVRNFENRVVTAMVELEIRAGLDEQLHTVSQQLTLAANEVTQCRFPWTAGKREFGHEARVRLVVNGQPVHTASEFFSVSFPVWKTAIQGSGFITWVGREQDFPRHVAANRAHYVNVEEAFSWQPSSWTDLMPEGEDWWTGQGSFHNSRAGLEQWMGLSHANGIKMITYLWPTASGPSGLKWARENPDLVAQSGVGWGGEFFDVEDLRLQEITAADRRLWRLRSGIWDYVGVDRGLLRGLDAGFDQVIASAKKFGWDGVRFDTPPSWGAMDAAELHADFRGANAEALMKKLVPEYFAQTSGQWSAEAVSTRNIRYARHKLREALPQFAISSNWGMDLTTANPVQRKIYDESCVDGGQIMDEAIRLTAGSPWTNYARRIQTQVADTRQRGGFHCAVALNATDALTRAYAQICVFAGGSHPYGDYGWTQPIPGRYTQFVTRYGEFCWAADLAPVAADTTGFAVNDDSLWWRDWVRQRALSDGRQQWVMQLITPPPVERVAELKPATMKPWRRDLSVSRKTAQPPTVWALSAEPTTRATPLTPRAQGEGFVVEVPEHRQWTTLVWTEGMR